MTVEKRIANWNPEFRAFSEGDDLIVEGYASKNNVLSHDIKGFRERTAPGFCRDSIAAGDDCVFTVNHNENWIGARTKNGTLRLSEDNVGLRFHAQLDRNNSFARDVHAQIRRGDLADCSFAFVPLEEDWDGVCDLEKGGVGPIRTLKKVRLLDVAVVTRPAYPQTEIAARAAATDPSVTQADIRCFEARQRIRKQQSRALAQKLLREYSPLCAEEIRSVLRIGDIDVTNRLRAIAYAKEIRESGAGVWGVSGPRAEVVGFGDASSGSAGVGSRIASGGQPEDPTFSMRVKSRRGHQRASAYHRDAAGKATDSMSRIRHDVAANAHADAAYCWPDSEKSQRARNASADCFPASMVS